MKKDTLVISLVLGLLGATMLTLCIIGVVMIIDGKSSLSSSLSAELTSVTGGAKTAGMTTTTTAGMKPNRKGSTIDDLVPMGTYEEIGNKYCDVQLKIKNVIRGEKASEMLKRFCEEDMEYMIVQYSLKVTRLDQETFSPSAIYSILKDGTRECFDYLTYSYDEKNWSNFVFATTGSVESCLIFKLPKNQVKCLYYASSGRVTYFACQ